jgi:hypothetical protein
VNLNKIDHETLVLRKYVHHVDILCHMTVIRNWTGCARLVMMLGMSESVNQNRRLIKRNYGTKNRMQKEKEGNV